MEENPRAHQAGLVFLAALFSLGGAAGLLRLLHGEVGKLRLTVSIASLALGLGCALTALVRKRRANRTTR